MTEIDYSSYEKLTQKFANNSRFKIIHENSLIKINNNKYSIGNEFLIIGNPPFNDKTSFYKKGQKNFNITDQKIYNNDIGISFFRLYSFLSPKYVCVVHPLAYLIKKTKFESLKEFKNNYIILKSTIFSSHEFEDLKNKKKTEFPMCVTLFKLDKKGMNYEFIKNFNFNILNSKNIFCLKNIRTIDGIVNKFPTKIKNSNIQFYTLRDINALKKNADFLIKPINNSVDVDIENLWQYGWIFYFKKNFNNNFLSGNLSPLFPNDEIINSNFKKQCVYYAFNNSKTLKMTIDIKKIENDYGKAPKNFNILKKTLDEMDEKFKF